MEVHVVSTPVRQESILTCLRSKLAFCHKKLLNSNMEWLIISILKHSLVDNINTQKYRIEDFAVDIKC